ncbi:MAG TPA: ABC transporter substrate-binding protein, partial [Anaerolineae bacterium]
TDLKPIPDLAESWEISDDGLVYTFHLREGVKFHDGEEMTADDVVYTAELFLDENNNSPYRNKFIIGEEPVIWEKIDDYTVQATLPQPSSSFLAKTSRADEIFFTILPKHILEKCDSLETCDEFNQHPIGTGPFTLAEYVPDQRVVQEAFDDYFQGKPGVRQVIRLALPNEQSALAALKSGEIDVATLREAGNVNAADSDPNLSVYRYDSNWIMVARFNMANPMLEDIRVRQAIAQAVDRENLVKAAVGPTAKPGNSPINVGWGANPEIEGLAYDPELAKSLLDEAGWVPGSDGIRTKDGQTLSLSILFQEGSGRPELATGMQQFLKEVGIDLQLQQLETATFDETVFQNKEFDMYLNWDGFGVDPDVASRWLTSTAEEGTYLSNPSSFSNSEVDTLFAEAQVASTLEERQEKLWAATEMIADDVPAVWLYLYEAQMAVSNNVGGLSLPPSTADMDNTAIFREPWKVTSERPYIE